MARKQTYEVLVMGSMCVVVEANSKSEALEKANFGTSSHSLRGFEADEFSINEVLKTPDAIASSIRHGSKDLR